MSGFNINWFLGVLAIELWIAPYLLVFWPDLMDAWAERRMERRFNRYADAYERLATYQEKPAYLRLS
jgi:hypothetical protein